jgi:hypothetical protein
MDNQFDFGPQYRKDPPFTARMRFHQSWYRANVLKVPYGVGPKITNKTYYGNMLTLEDGEKGLNFLRPHIFEVAKRRIADSKGTVDRFRLLSNLLSSQPMCFNLFGPLVDDLDLATLLFSACLPGEIKRVDAVRLEYAPEPANEYLNDRTAFDAYVEYTRPDDSPAFIGLETRLSESFSQKTYTQPSYWQWTKNPNSPWPEASWPRLIESDVNQIWRHHLLAVALLRHPNSGYAAGRFLVVYHPLDQGAIQPLKSYRSLLKPADQTFAELPLDHLVDLWADAAADAAASAADREWLSNFRTRYIDLSASEDEFQAFVSRR